MIEIAAGYIGAYLTRKSLGVLERAGSEADAAVDDKLSQLYNWVKAKFTGRPSSEMSLSLLEESPEGETQQALVADQLSQVVQDDDAAIRELHVLVEELDRVRPSGITIRGLARAEDIYGQQVGAEVEGSVPQGSEIIGEAVAGTIREGGKSVGARLRNLP
jgi:hypothetical protein